MENRLEEILKEQGRKKSWLADQVEVSRNTITELIKGREPHLGLAYKVANTLEKSVYDIWPNIGL